MKQSQKGSAGPFIIIAILVIVIFVLGYSYYNKPSTSPQSNNLTNSEISESSNIADDSYQIYRTPETRAEAGQVEFFFNYPVGYQVIESGYTTPGGYLYPSVKIVRNGEQKDNNYVTISENPSSSTATDLSCETGAFTKCREVGDYIIYTRSSDKYVADLYVLIESTLTISPKTS